MPNWCENRLRIRGTKDNLEQFKSQVKGKAAVYAMSPEERVRSSKGMDEIKTFTFNSLVPVPKEVLMQGYSNAGHEWQSHNWGTKWDVSSMSPSEEYDNEIIYVFQTAWSPPEAWVSKVSSLFPELTFELSYFEPGMMFAGFSRFINGVLTNSHHVSQDVEEIKVLMVEKLGYSEEEANDFWSYDEDMEEM